MLPIIRTELKKLPYHGNIERVNVVLDKNGRECVMLFDGLHLLTKNGNIGKRLSKAW